MEESNDPSSSDSDEICSNVRGDDEIVLSENKIITYFSKINPKSAKGTEFLYESNLI